MDGAPVVFSGNWDRVSLWDARTGQLWHWLEGHTGKVRSVGLGEIDDDPVIVSGGEDGTVRLWDARTGRPRGQPLQGHIGGVLSVALGEVYGNPVVVSGGRDGTVRLWDARTREQFGVVYASSKDVYTALRSQLLVVCSYDDGFFMLELLLRSR